jgi:hypothetical protein
MSKKPSKVSVGGAAGAGGRERGEWIEEKEGCKVRGGVERKKERRVRPIVDITAKFVNLVKVGLTG